MRSNKRTWHLQPWHLWPCLTICCPEYSVDFASFLSAKRFLAELRLDIKFLLRLCSFTLQESLHWNCAPQLIMLRVTLLRTQRRLIWAETSSPQRVPSVALASRRTGQVHVEQC